MYVVGYEEDKGCYGYDSVKFALEQNAIKELLVSDSLYRSFDPEKRNKYVRLVAKAKEKGAIVHHLSSAHPPGE